MALGLTLGPRCHCKHVCPWIVHWLVCACAKAKENPCCDCNFRVNTIHTGYIVCSGNKSQSVSEHQVDECEKGVIAVHCSDNSSSVCGFLKWILPYISAVFCANSRPFLTCPPSPHPPAMNTTHFPPRLQFSYSSLQFLSQSLLMSSLEPGKGLWLLSPHHQWPSWPLHSMT